MQIRGPLQNLQTSCGTPSSVMKAAWALLLSQALETKDITFGEVSTNRYLPVPGLHDVRGPCLNLLPVRARLDEGMTLASLITQVQDQSVASLPHHHLGFRSIIKDCTAWPRWTLVSKKPESKGNEPSRPIDLHTTKQLGSIIIQWLSKCLAVSAVVCLLAIRHYMY